MRLSLLVPATLLSLLPLGCGGNEPQANMPNQYGQQGQYGQQPAQYGQQPGQYGQPAPQQGYGIPGFGQPGSPSAPATGGAAQPLPPVAMMAATPMLMPLAQTEAPGAQPVGSPFGANFQEGQVLEQQINIEPGKCYTVVAGGMGVQQVDVQIVAQFVPMMPPTVVATSTGAGPTAVIGGKKAGCVRNPLPVGAPAKVVLKATKGAGMAAAQVYAK